MTAQRSLDRSPDFVLVANPGSRRAELFLAALERVGASAKLVSWIDLLGARVHLADVVATGSVLRIDSPGRDFEVERALLAAGAEVVDEEECTTRQHFSRLDPTQVAALEPDKGLILPSRQWYLGFRRTLRDLEAQLVSCPPHRLLASPRDIEVLFDKVACQERLATAGVAIPAPLGVVADFADLRVKMEQAGRSRVFLKIAHGSSGSGVAAYATGGRGGQQALTTTVEMVRTAGGTRLYNSRQIRTVRDLGEIATLVDTLATHRLYAEQWLPKAGIEGQAADLRVLTIGGEPRHMVARLSRSPITNLHLLNQRAPAEVFRGRMTPVAWEGAMATCRAAARCFPGSQQLGIDLLVGADFCYHAVLEANAFGDLLPGALDQGQDSYDAQIAALGFGPPPLRHPSAELATAAVGA